MALLFDTTCPTNDINNNMKTIGLLIAYKNPNYGTMLQAFATQYVIDKLGFNTEIIDYYPSRFNKHYKLDFGLLHFLWDSYISKKKRKKRIQNSDVLFQKNLSKRKSSYEEFIKSKLHGICKIYGYSKLKAKGEKFDAVLIGSDQKWTPGFSFGVDSSFRFVPKHVRTISYATSLGVSEYPNYCKNSAREVWKRINYLSVREYTGAKIIKSICGENTPVQVVVDPTYLITKEEWDKIFPRKKLYEDKYIFCYFLGNDVESKQCARRYADANDFKLVSVISNESYSDIDQQYADFLVIGDGPENFVNWIRGAECVFTDSFHGTAFSVINEKQIYISYRKNDSVKLKRHSRIDNILDLWNIKNRLITDKRRDWNTYIEKPINFEDVNEKIAAERKKSLSFLKESLTF